MNALSKILFSDIATSPGERERDVARKRIARSHAKAVGKIPDVVNPKRRAACERNFRLYCTTYHPQLFEWKFSAGHKRVMATMQSSVLAGGLFCEAVFRGWGKTTSAECLIEFAAVYGHRKFLVPVAADRDAAEDIIASLLVELEQNDLLLEDFPEICYPFRALEGIAQRCSGQEYAGRRTYIERSQGTIVFPYIPGAAGAGVIIKACGIGGRLRGMKHKLPDGTNARPDFVLLEDIQKEDDAKSTVIVPKLEKLIDGAILNMSSHKRRISGLMTCTVIETNDVPDRYLNIKLHPEWQSERLGMVIRWADKKVHDKWWMGKYADILRDPSEPDPKVKMRTATEFYRANREKMDQGVVVAWEECYIRQDSEDEIAEVSAVQHAYNLFILRGEKIFAAEYMNQPLVDDDGQEPPLEANDLITKLNNLARYKIPGGYTTLVAHIDPGVRFLHVTTIALGDHFSAAVVDYKRQNYRVKDPGKFRGGMEAIVRAEVNLCIARLLERKYPVDTGGDLSFAAIGVDAGWQAKTIYKLIREHEHKSILIPTKGQPGQIRLTAPKSVPRRDRGHGWFLALTKTREARLLQFDKDLFTSFLNERLRTPPGGPGALMLYGSKAQTHWDYCRHLTGEVPIPITLKDGTAMDDWTQLPGREIHWLDTAVGCMVLGHKLGLTLEPGRPKRKKKRRPRPGKEKKVRTKY